MDNQVIERLKSKVLEDINNLDSLEHGSEEYERSVTGICNMCKCLTEADKNEIVYGSELDKAEQETKFKEKELELKAKELKQDRIFRIVQTCAAGGQFLILLLAKNKWFREGLKFEETGTYSAQTFKNLLSKMPDIKL